MVGGAIGIGTKGNKFAMILAGGLTGGISAEMAGGNFWAGARQGLITAGLNHAAHMVADGINNRILEVIIWKETSKKDVGHLAIRIDDKVYGFYPTDINGDNEYSYEDLKNSPGDMHIDDYNTTFKENYNNEEVKVFGINATDEQVNRVESFLDWVSKNPGKYELSGNNCTSVGVQALKSAGIVMRDQTNSPMWGYSTKPSSVGFMLSRPFNKHLISYQQNIIIKK
jgi:hypothetical protein